MGTQIRLKKVSGFGCQVSEKASKKIEGFKNSVIKELKADAKFSFFNSLIPEFPNPILFSLTPDTRHLKPLTIEQ